MTLCKGTLIRLLSIDQTTAGSSDWLSSRAATPGDIAVVEEVSIVETGRVVRLKCEPRAGFPEWGTWFLEAGLTYEVLLRPDDTAY